MELEPVAHEMLNLIEKTIQISRSFEYQKHSSIVHSRDLQHIQISLPRRMGHTTVAFQLLLRHPSSLIMFPNSKIRSWYMSQYPDYFDRHPSAKEILVDTSANDTNFRDRLIRELHGPDMYGDLLIVDNAMMYNEEKKDIIHSLFGGYVSMIVFLG